MIATEEKENKVKYAWKKPTIGNLTAGLTESVSCLLPFVSQELGICSERSQQALRLSKKFHWSLPQVWPLSLSDFCPLSRAETADLYNRGERLQVRSSIVFTARCNYVALSNVWMSTLHVHMGSQYPNILVPLALWLKSDLVYQSHRNKGLDRRCHLLQMYLTKIKNIFAQTLSL